MSAVAQVKKQGFVRRYIFSRDHKIIGLQYFFLALFSALLGITLSLLMRSHLAAPERKIFGMSAGQRLLLSILLFATVFLLGLSCLLVTNKVWPT